MKPEQATRFEIRHPECIVIDSEEIDGVRYIFKSGQAGGIIINAGRYGSIAIRRSLVVAFLDELSEIAEEYIKK